jgi:hypothetical protein
LSYYRAVILQSFDKLKLKQARPIHEVGSTLSSSMEV